jgi:hypothetical protein
MTLQRNQWSPCRRTWFPPVYAIPGLWQFKWHDETYIWTLIKLLGRTECTSANYATRFTCGSTYEYQSRRPIFQFHIDSSIAIWNTAKWSWKNCGLLPNVGRAVAQAVSRWLPTAAARVRVQVACEVCGGESGIGAGFLQVLWFPLPNHHSTNFFIIINTRGRHNRTIIGRSAQWTQLDSTPHYTKNSLMPTSAAQWA